MCILLISGFAGISVAYSIPRISFRVLQLALLAGMREVTRSPPGMHLLTRYAWYTLLWQHCLTQKEVAR
jgi:hypothetical protein